MKTRITLSAFFFVIIVSAQQLSTTDVNVVAGKIVRIESFPSQIITPRNIDIWLPNDYNSNKKYDVVYMHDGQMLFDSTKTWNHKEWKVDEVFSELIKTKRIKDCIVVGIWNNGADRISEYFPTKIYNKLSDNQKQQISQKYANGKPANGDNYLKFIVEELKPYIDNNFSTFSDKDHNFMMGSSMGGLISIYGICEYPEVFGGVACLSTAWFSFIEPNYEFPMATFDYLQENMVSAFGHKMYMDYGSGESDKPYELTQSFVDLIAKGKGFTPTIYMSKIYENDKHEENAWSRRLDVPVLFLLGKKPIQKPTTGKIDVYENFSSKFVTSRNVEVWLPESYNQTQKYAVLYMHDGQLLFDSTTTWNHQAWNADIVASKLMTDKKVQQFIIVGIDNGGITRHKDYFPQKPFESLTPDQKDFVNKKLQSSGKTNEKFHPVSDNYLKFLVKELKPFIDKTYSVYKDRSHTFIAGSSMGGLISMYAICEYPNIFGGAACMSTHWPGIFAVDNNPVPDAFLSYMENKLPNTRTHKIYFDYGDKTLDAMYQPFQNKVDTVMKQKGFTVKNWITKFFPGQNHSEKSWNSRLSIPLIFLLKN
jgi:predicted alpha/beta superfamily hydrolase